MTIDSLLVPAVLQHTALEAVTAPGWRRSLVRLQTELHRRRQLAVSTLTETLGAGALPHLPRGGYHLWVTLHDHRSGTEFARAALAGGVALTPGENYFAPGNDHRAHVRLSYVATPTAEDVRDAVRRLGTIL